MTKLTTRKTASPKRTDSKSASIKLTDRQLIVLSGAKQRHDGAATFPDSIKDKAAHKLGTTLIEKGLMRAVRAKPGMPVWRRSTKGDAQSLIITELGRSTRPGDEDEANGAHDATTVSRKKVAASAALRPKTGSPRRGSKLSEVIAMLSRGRGASIDELMSATGWLPHTTRAALSDLGKRGYGVERHRPEKGEASIYRIVDGSAQILAA